MDLNIIDGIEPQVEETVQPTETEEVSEIKDVVTVNSPIPNEPLKISRDNFRILTECIGLMPALISTDCDINHGLIRQPDNFGNHITELDITSILTERSLSISNAKDKYSLMKSLEVDESVDWAKDDLLLIETEKAYQITDKASTITFKKPVRSLMGNVFITKEQLKIRADVDEKNMIFSLEIKPHMSKRIKSMCDSMQTDIITIEMKDSKGNMFIRNKNNTDEVTARVIQDFDLDRKMPSSVFSFSSIPFKICTTSDMTVKLFKQSKNCLAFFEQKLFNTIVYRLYSLVTLAKL